MTVGLLILSGLAIYFRDTTYRKIVDVMKWNRAGIDDYICIKWAKSGMRNID